MLDITMKLYICDNTIHSATFIFMYDCMIYSRNLWNSVPNKISWRKFRKEAKVQCSGQYMHDNLVRLCNRESLIMHLMSVILIHANKTSNKVSHLNYHGIWDIVCFHYPFQSFIIIISEPSNESCLKGFLIAKDPIKMVPLTLTLLPIPTPSILFRWYLKINLYNLLKRFEESHDFSLRKSKFKRSSMNWGLLLRSAFFNQFVRVSVQKIHIMMHNNNHGFL